MHSASAAAHTTAAILDAASSDLNDQMALLVRQTDRPAVWYPESRCTELISNGLACHPGSWAALHPRWRTTRARDADVHEQRPDHQQRAPAATQFDAPCAAYGVRGRYPILCTSIAAIDGPNNGHGIGSGRRS